MSIENQRTLVQIWIFRIMDIWNKSSARVVCAMGECMMNGMETVCYCCVLTLEIDQKRAKGLLPYSLLR